jgi:hypothetical protein
MRTLLVALALLSIPAFATDDRQIDRSEYRWMKRDVARERWMENRFARAERHAYRRAEREWVRANRDAARAWRDGYRREERERIREERRAIREWRRSY